jgi:hypothetical protein
MSLLASLKTRRWPRVADWVMNYTMPGSPFDPRNPRHPYDIDYPPFTGHKRHTTCILHVIINRYEGGARWILGTGRD